MSLVGYCGVIDCHVVGSWEMLLSGGPLHVCCEEGHPGQYGVVGGTAEVLLGVGWGWVH